MNRGDATLDRAERNLARLRAGRAHGVPVELSASEIWEIHKAAFAIFLEMHAEAKDDTPVPLLCLMMALWICPDAPAITDALLDEVFSPKDAGTIRRWFRERLAPECLCSACGMRMHGGYPKDELPHLELQHIFALTPEGFRSFFLCERCGELWKAYGEQALPNIRPSKTVN